MLALLAALQALTPPPFPSYWQQHLSYRIEVSLDEAAGLLRGTQRVVYENRSPDTLGTIAFHLYLNAFRPGSRWADADSVEGRRRFNDLADPDHGMNRVRNVRIGGRAVEPVYPFAPDSTVVRFVLPEPLAPGGSLTAELEFEARPSTVLRRQGRRGRAYDFAQWYPRVVAYDKHGWQEHPLYPAGEFYGDFGDFTVSLDVPEDQVIGATGVPLCGDPGWEAANRTAGRTIDYQRDFYPAAPPSSADCRPRAAGRKTVVWRAENVHHFAMSMRPDYRYEGGRAGDVAVHVLYQPGDESTWGGGVAVQRTETALAWLDELFGRYPWPQMTNVHRLEGGGTEFPMMMHNGSASQGLILHEGGHNYLMGILASNEWREGFLDEGFTSFQTTWFFEEQGVRGAYQANERRMLDLDLDGWSEPTSYRSEDYRDFATYGAMIYNRGELFFHQLRDIVGHDVMRRILRTYYERWQLRHVDEEAFRQVAEEVSGRDLSTFFAQWLHGNVLYDYSIGRVRSTKRADGRWVTRVEVRRKSAGVYPVEVAAIDDGDTVSVRAEGRAEREWVEIETGDRPDAIMIDPRARSHDWNMLNNRKARPFFGLFGWQQAPRTDLHFDRVFSTRVHRDRRAVALLPTVWYNDVGGVTVGYRHRSNYLGRFDETVFERSVPLRDCCDDSERTDNWYFRLRNPTWLHAPRLSTGFEAYHVEGRQGAQVSMEKTRLGHLGYGPVTSWGLALRWLATYDTEWLDPALYGNGGTVEATFSGRSRERRGAWQVAGEGLLGLGVEYRNRGAGLDTDDRHDTQSYLRLAGTVTARRSLTQGVELGIRAFGGIVRGGSTDPLRQRWFYLAGADPYEQLAHPFVRSRGALLTDDVHVHTPGGGNVRGLARDVAVTSVAALNVEVDRSILARARPGLFQDTRVALFGDVALSDGFFSFENTGDVSGDAGVGVRFTHTIGQTTFVTRFDFPIYVSHPDRAIGGAAADGPFRLRWTMAFSPTF